MHRNQEEILQMLARRHKDEQQKFAIQLLAKKHYELLAQNCSDMISLHNVESFVCKYVSFIDYFTFRFILQLFRYVSPSCESLLGYTQEEMQYMNYTDLVHIDNRTEARDAVRKLLEVARSGAKELPSCQQVCQIVKKVH